MPYRIRDWLFPCVAAALFSAAAHAEMVDNPEYAKWSRYKPGAMAKLEGASKVGDIEHKQTLTTTLIELLPEKAVVETRVSVDYSGDVMEAPAVKLDVPAKIESGRPQLPDGIDPTQVKGGVKTSEETLAAAGKSFKCSVVEVNIERTDYTATVKLWTSADVPGGQVKIERHTQGKKVMSTTMTLTEFKTGQ